MAKQKMTAEEYLLKCQEYCSRRLTDPAFFAENDSNVEIIPRCGYKTPEHWTQEEQNRWWAWIYCGGTIEGFGYCDLKDCPMHEAFLRTAPYKHIRNLVA